MNIQATSLQQEGWQEIDRGSPTAIPGLTVQMEPGVLYEAQYISQDPITSGIAWLTAQINAAISSLFGVKTEYIRVEGKTLHHGFMIPKAMEAEVRAFGLPAIGGVITLVSIVLVIIGILLIVVYMFVPGGAEDLDKLFRSIPGMAVMMVGGVLVSVLPKLAKIAGLVPLGVGGFMVYNSFLGSPPSPPPGNGDGNDGTIPKLLNPPAKNASWYKNFPVEFRWTSVTGATSYGLWFNGSNFPEEIIPVDSTSWTLVSDAAGVHHWKVRAMFGSEPGGWSEARSFIII